VLSNLRNGGFGARKISVPLPPAPVKNKRYDSDRAGDFLFGYAITLEEDQAVFWRRAGEGTQAWKPAQTIPTPAIGEDATHTPRKVLLSSRAIEEVRKIAAGLAPYWLESTYIGWAKDKDEARDEDARFLKWAASFTKRRAGG
jgi:hypothetical protein